MWLCYDSDEESEVDNAELEKVNLEALLITTLVIHLVVFLLMFFGLELYAIVASGYYSAEGEFRMLNNYCCSMKFVC